MSEKIRPEDITREIGMSVIDGLANDLGDISAKFDVDLDMRYNDASESIELYSEGNVVFARLKVSVGDWVTLE